ncbi:hypothetical protein GGI14_003998 [Coemansia sp. S680]|nr:hypothetical protein GGI14_003998 [Coemansia sp. S680]
MSLDAKDIDTVAVAPETATITMADRKAAKEQRKAEKHAKQQAKREKRDKKASRPWEFDPKTKNSLVLGGNSRGGNKRARPTRNNDNDGDNSAADNSDVDDTPPQFKMEMPPVQKKSRKLKTDNMAETKLQGLPVEFEGQKITFGD